MPNFISQAANFITAPDPHARSARLYWLWSALLFLGGLLVWLAYFHWGLGPFTSHDWSEITMPRMTFLQDAMRQGVLPLHITQDFSLGSFSDRFLTLPDAFISPQIILLRWLDVPTFLLVNFTLLYAAGYAGLLWLARKIHLSPLAFTVLFLLFNFNGHMLAHFSVGHYTWTAAFLFPWLIGLVVELFDGPAGWRWVLRATLLLFVMVLQGGYHQFIWSLFLLGLLVPVLHRHFWVLAKTLVFGVLVNALRLLPPALNLGKFDNNFTAGYPFVHSIWFALTSVYVPNDYTVNLFLTSQIGTWEYDLFVGVIAALFVLGFGGLMAWRNRQQAGSYAALLIPVIGLTVLSLDRFYRVLRSMIPLPIFTGERVSARIILLAFILLLVLAVIELQRWLDVHHATPPALALGLTGLFLLAGNDLWQNFRLWRVADAAEKSSSAPIDAARYAVTNHPDPTYVLALGAGALISLLSFVTLISLARRDRRP